MMFVGFAAGILGERIGLPRVATYVVVGAVFSEQLLGRWFSQSLDSWSPVLTDVALAVIAYLVGAEIHLKQVHRQERSVFAGALGQLLAVWALVSAGVWLYSAWTGGNFSIGTAVILGSIGTATAPAAIIAVLDEYKARGKMSDILLGIVAIDDALGIIAFTLAIGLVGVGEAGSGLASVAREIGGAVFLGGAIGAILGLIGRKVCDEDLRLPIILAAIFVAAGLSQRFEVSTLLSCMTLGLVSKILFRGDTEQWLLPSNHIREVIFLIFFLLAGRHFQPMLFVHTIGLIAVYVVARSVGKIGGATLGVTLAGAPTEVKKYLGICLLPQAGVAIGLALKAAQYPALQEIGPTLMNVVLGSTIIFALTAPIGIHWALRKTGEIDRPHR